MRAERFVPRRPGKRLAGAFIALVVVALSASFAVPATAATSGAITVAAVPADSGDVTAGTALRLSVSLTNGGVATTADGTAAVSVAATPFSSRAALADWFSGASKTNLATRAVGTSIFPSVEGGFSDAVPVTIPADALPFSAAGVYPVLVSITAGGKRVGEARSAIAWSVSASAAVPVAIAVPLTVPAGESTFLTSAELTAYTAPGGILTRELADVANSQAAVGIDPRILASIRVLGNAAPQSARDWLDQLALLPNETFPLAWADADLTAPLHAGQESVLTTKSLDYAIDPTQFPVTNPSTSTTPTPEPTNGTGAPVLPTNSSLIAWTYTLPTLSWPAEDSVEASDLEKLGDAGMTSAILSSSNVDGMDARGEGGAAGKVGTTSLAVSDSVMSDYLRTAIQSSTRATSGAAMTELTTTLALTSLESGGSPRPVLLTLGRNWAYTESNFARGVNLLNSHPWTSTATVSSVLKSDAATVSIVKKTESKARIALVASMLAAEQGVVQFAPVAENPDLLISSTRLKLLSLLSNEWTSTPWRTAGKAFLTQSNKIVTSVQVDPSSEILAFADKTSLPVSISNDFDQDVTVNLQVRSLSTRLAIGDVDQAQSVVVGEGAQRRILIPVSALSNGKAEIVATIMSNTGLQIGRTVTIQVNVQAGWETAGTLIFAALIVALFAFGIIRTIRKRRRDARQADTT